MNFPRVIQNYLLCLNRLELSIPCIYTSNSKVVPATVFMHAYLFVMTTEFFVEISIDYLVHTKRNTQADFVYAHA